MRWLRDLIANPLLLAGLSAWFAAQVLKVGIFWIMNGKLEWERLFGDGGMPSGHAATVTSVAVYAGFSWGTGSFPFGICALLAIIVCHDAMGVRWETGKQAMVLNRLLEDLQELRRDKPSGEKLKELVGHTPVQVLAGCLLGGTMGFLMYRLLHS